MVDEADMLSDLAFRSKAHWGYPPEFMEACRDELTVTSSAIAAGRVFVLDDHWTPVGVYSLDDLPDGGIELGHLFVEPGRFGTGVGRQLVEHACRTAHALGYRRLVIQGDPNAEGFYARCGAVRIGDRQSASIPGRKLPLFEIDLDGTG
jgi:GNAT superfamily N-acetyltransferase